MNDTTINMQPKYLFNHESLFLHAITNAQSIVLFLDYDGTLIPFEKKPEDVKTPDNVLNLLKNISVKPEINIVIITGRQLHEIKQLVCLDTISYAALHGLHILFSDGNEKVMKNVESIKIKIDKIKKELEKTLEHVEGAIIEDKQYAIAVHYRMVKKNNLDAILKKCREIMTRYHNDDIETIEGDKVIEARLKGWNKGNAVDFLLNQFNQINVTLPIYIGDDTTDEDAFNYLTNKGFTIFVKNNSSLKTNAHYWVDNPSEVYLLLQKISDIKK
jgi:trehalose 6-phosphate phosphatase